MSKKTERITISLSVEEKSRIADAAQWLGIGVSTFVRLAATGAAYTGERGRTEDGNRENRA
jgi:uncharacterized protein (DUF1778 family)